MKRRRNTDENLTHYAFPFSGSPSSALVPSRNLPEKMSQENHIFFHPSEGEKEFRKEKKNKRKSSR